MLLRYRPECLADAGRRELWRDIDARLLALPDTHHGNWTGHQEGLYQTTLGFQGGDPAACHILHGEAT